MTFSVGYQADRAWMDALVARRAARHDVSFAYGAMPSGRAPVADEDRQLEDLGRLADAGIPLHLLFNANCYGARALSRAFLTEVGETVDRFAADGSLTGVTTTSPVLARFIRANFPGLEIRASVNMEIGTVEGMDYLQDVFDGFYLKRELNRDLDAVRAMKTWCDDHGKRLYILANSGCLNHCSSHVFHDNLVAHEVEIARADNGYTFHGTCWAWLAKPANRAQWYARTNFIEPERVDAYEGLCTAMKLATRINAHPVRILESYATGSHIGPMQPLLEPNHGKLFETDAGRSPTTPTTSTPSA